MRRRGFYIIGILLFCLLAVSCRSKKEEPEDTEFKNNYTSFEELTPSTDDITDKDAVNNEATITKNDATITKSDTAITKDSNAENIREEETQLQTNHGAIEADTLSAYNGEQELREAIKKYPAGTGINMKGAEKGLIDQLFYMEELSEEIKVRINGKSYGEDCELPYEELRYIRVLYCDFEGETRIGELMVNQAIAQDILEIFRELYEVSYPIERMLLVDEYDADDDKSMAANNTSAFNYRFVAGTTRLSKHSLGSAIDINPLYNPYITKIDGKTVILPEKGSEYADRSKDCPYYIHKGDPCYEAFVKRGFTWGGAWENSKDYQHFQKNIS